MVAGNGIEGRTAARLGAGFAELDYLFEYSYE
jgi:hypothetical protein